MVALFIIISLVRKKLTKGDFMHPKQICTDIESMGAKLILDGEDLYIENPENIGPEIEEIVKSYKSRVIAHLKGEYSNKLHGINQTIDKIIACFLGEEQAMNDKINDWLKHDRDSINMVLQLFGELWSNGWNVKEPVANYENDVTRELSEKIFNNAMAYFKKGAAVSERG